MGIFIERLGYFSRELFVGISFSLVSGISFSCTGKGRRSRNSFKVSLVWAPWFAGWTGPI